MLYRVIIAVCTEIHTKHINTLCGQNVNFFMLNLVVYIVTTGLYNIKENHKFISFNSLWAENRAQGIPNPTQKRQVFNHHVYCIYIHTYIAYQYIAIRTIISEMVQRESTGVTDDSIIFHFTFNKRFRCDLQNFQTLNIYNLSLRFLSTANKVSCPLDCIEQYR